MTARCSDTVDTARRDARWKIPRTFDLRCRKKLSMMGRAAVSCSSTSHTLNNYSVCPLSPVRRFTSTQDAASMKRHHMYMLHVHVNLRARSRTIVILLFTLERSRQDHRPFRSRLRLFRRRRPPSTPPPPPPRPSPPPGSRRARSSARRTRRASSARNRRRSLVSAQRARTRRCKEMQGVTRRYMEMQMHARSPAWRRGPIP